MTPPNASEALAEMRRCAEQREWVCEDVARAALKRMDEV